ncbi:MAG: MoaD/ThiS family protein [Acidobacteriota bacterium]
MSKVRIPTPLRKYTGGRDEVTTTGETLREVLENLGTEHDGILERICDTDGKLRRFVNVFLNQEDIRYLSGLDTPVKEEDVISIVPAIAGGR